MKFSQFGEKFTADSGIVSLMEDLGDALNVNPDILFMGGGNPAHIPEFEKEVSQHLVDIAKDPGKLHKLIGVYQSPQGSEEFIQALCPYINKSLGWNINERQIAITNGSQSAFFILINLLTGQTNEGTHKRIVFPMMPEYLGYADQAREPDVFRGYRPKIELRGEHVFKYHVDFSTLALNENDAALCVSSPANPTGNVLAAEEIEQLNAVARQANIPLIVDCAYGKPFPNVIYDETQIPYAEGNIYVMSCSKLGMPGARTGIVVGSEAFIEKLVNVNTIMSLANGNFGPSLVGSLLQGGKMETLCQNTLLPFYRSRRDFVIACLSKYFSGVPYRMHEAEGAFFLWLWFEGLPISSSQLYERMKAKGLLLMDGSHFFFGLDKPWQHSKECIRLTYCQSEEVIDKAMALLAGELKSLY